jgi:hypothetical protein
MYPFDATLMNHFGSAIASLLLATIPSEPRNGGHLFRSRRRGGDTASVFKGTIMAYQAITRMTGATLDGRALARVAAVALDTNTVTRP